MRVDKIKTVFALVACISIVPFVDGCGGSGSSSKSVDTPSQETNVVQSAAKVVIEGENCVDLIAGQSNVVGSVCSAVEGSNIVVTYMTTSDWLMTQVHLWAGTDMADMPQNQNGNPKLGQFPYSESFDPGVMEYSIEIPLSVFGLDENMEVCDPVTAYIVAHADVESQGEGGGQHEGAYGDGGNVVTRGNWSKYFTMTLTCEAPDTATPPVELTCETAFAYDESGTCFYDSELIEANRWGWTIGPLAPGDYSFDIYAAAGQCILENGTLTGVLNVSYDGSTANVSYEMNPDFLLGATHLYAGSDPFPMDNKGNFTVAPGQYGNIHELEEFAASDSLIIEGLSGDIFIIAHAQTCAENWPED